MIIWAFCQISSNCCSTLKTYQLLQIQTNHILFYFIYWYQFTQYLIKYVKCSVLYMTWNGEVAVLPANACISKMKIWFQLFFLVFNSVFICIQRSDRLNWLIDLCYQTRSIYCIWGMLLIESTNTITKSFRNKIHISTWQKTIWIDEQ